MAGNNPVQPKRSALYYLLEDCESAVGSLEWLLKRYDDGDHEITIETMQLLIPTVRDKLCEAMELVSNVDEAEAGHA